MGTPMEIVKVAPLTLSDSVSGQDGGNNVVNLLRNVRPARKADPWKKMAAGLGALWADDDEKPKLQSPSASVPLEPLAVQLPKKNAGLLTLEPSPAQICGRYLVNNRQDLDNSHDLDATGIDGYADGSMDISNSVVGDRVRSEWVGTSQFFVEQNIELQESGQLGVLLSYFQATSHELSLNPYDPVLYISLSRIVSKIGFADIGIANAYRAVLLIEGFSLRDPTTYPEIRTLYGNKLRTQNDLIIEDEIQVQLLYAYRELLSSMLGCACFWDGVIIAKKALKLFPRDPELLQARTWLLEGFQDRCDGLKSLGAKPKELIARSRVGKIYQKLYPWMNKDLFKRKPALVRDVNKNFGAGNCEVRPVVFGPPSSRPEYASVQQKERQDVGPLGIFASKNIREGEIVLVDQHFSVISDVPSSRLVHCDCCHTSLLFPFQDPAKIIRPSCCNTVAFCSMKCYDTASKGYHTILCGKDISWLYEKQQDKAFIRPGYQWPSVMFLRLIAIVLADRHIETKSGKKPTHPLQHPLIARMTANYSPPQKLHPDELMDWDFDGNIVAPTRVLVLLGINIFTDKDFSQDVIQTIFWRITNNASMSTSDLTLKTAPKTSDATSLTKSANEVQQICLNPSYLFFNHSCRPNVSWHGSIPDASVDVAWLRGYNGEIVRKPGSSTVFCRAAMDIKKGEELKISYIGDPAGDRVRKRRGLKKWFEGGCGCEVCIEENRAAEARRGATSGEVDGEMKERVLAQI